MKKQIFSYFAIMIMSLVITSLVYAIELGQLNAGINVTTPTPLYVNNVIQFNGLSTTFPFGTSITSYNWNFGDTTTATGIAVSHQYTQIGEYIVTLTVTDSNGNTDTEQVNVTISAEGNADLIAVQTDISNLSITFAPGDNINNVRKNFTVPLSGSNGTTITWSESSSNIAINPLTGYVTVTQPTVANWASATIFATVSKNGTSDNIGFELLIPKFVPDPTNVYIPDANLLKLLIATGLDLDNNGAINQAEAEAATEFKTLSNNIGEYTNSDRRFNISSLQGLEAFTNLTDITLSNVKNNLDETFYVYLDMNNLSELSSLTKLKNFSINDGNISDISGLLGSKDELYSLSLSNQNVSDVSVLTQMTELSYLSLNSNPIEDISMFQNIGSLRIISLRNTLVKDISVLSDIHKRIPIGYLDLTGSPINNSLTPGVYHETTKDFTVDGVNYEVWVQDPTNIYIPDANLLKLMIIAGLDLDNNGAISQAEAEAATKFQTLSNNIGEYTNPDRRFNISNLQGLEAFINLTDISLFNVKNNSGDIFYVYLDMNNLSTLSSLAKLKSFRISDGNVSDISGLLGSKNELCAISLANQNVSDITTLGQMTKLVEVNLYANPVSEISALGNLTKLKDIELRNTLVKDISVLSDIHKVSTLTSLDLTGAPINNSLTPGVYHETTKDFTVDGVNYEVWVQDPTNIYIPDSNLLKLMIIAGFDLDNNGAINQAEAEAVTTFQTLHNNIGEYTNSDRRFNISSLQGLEAFINLTNISLFNLKNNNGDTFYVYLDMNNLSTLSSLTKLRSFRISDGNISDISGLLGSKNELYAISLANQNVSDITALGQMTKLMEINLYANPVSDISALGNLTKLKDIELRNTLIKDISVLSDINKVSTLTSLNLIGAPINNSLNTNAYHAEEKDFTVNGIKYEVWKEVSNDDEALLRAKDSLTGSKFVYSKYTDNIDNISGTFTLPISYIIGTNIVWDHNSELLAIDNITGVVTVSLPSNFTEKTENLVATIQKNGKQTVKILTIKLVKPSLSGNSTPVYNGSNDFNIKDNSSNRIEFIAPIFKNGIPQNFTEIGKDKIFSVNLDSEAPKISGELSGDVMKEMVEKEAIFEIKTKIAEYKLPTKDIDIEGILEKIGEDYSLSDLEFSIDISKSTPEKIEFMKSLEDKQNIKLIIDPIDFEITCSVGDKQLTIDTFTSYVERVIPIPTNIDHTKITTAVIIQKDGSLKSVPTKIIFKDGKYYAEIKSTTNSTYALISLDKTFSDTQNDNVELLASKLIVKGTTENTFEPNKQISRAEFVTILVRSLGLESRKNSGFKDISDKDWYNIYVNAAVEYNLILGNGDNTFDGNRNITEKEVEIIFDRVAKLTNKSNSYKSKISNQNITREEMCNLIVNLLKETNLI